MENTRINDIRLTLIVLTHNHNKKLCLNVDCARVFEHDSCEHEEYTSKALE